MPESKPPFRQNPNTEKVESGEEKGKILITMTSMPAEGVAIFTSANNYKRTWVDPLNLSVTKTTYINTCFPHPLKFYLFQKII